MDSYLHILHEVLVITEIKNKTETKHPFLFPPGNQSGLVEDTSVVGTRIERTRE